jgi:nitrite reductase/ring-hydroxylating ferredoxin subunit
MQSETQTANWHNLGPLEQLETNGRALTKIEGRQIAIFATESGLYAINNRCPHEGYPLVEGTLQDSCSLACNWHGWKFDLRSGEALEGRDAVKTYNVENRAGDIWVEVLPPDPVEEQSKAFTELKEAVEEHDYSRIARALARHKKYGGAPKEPLRQILFWSKDRLERGFGHAHAGMADWIALAAGDDELERIAYLEAIGHFSWDSLFSGTKPVCGNTSPYTEEGLLSAIEAMDIEAAEAQINGAFQSNVSFERLCPVFQKVIYSHYAGFGHPAIYLQKARELIHSLGEETAHTLALQLARYLCVAAREDLIPEFRVFGEMLQAKPPGKAVLPKVELISGSSLKTLLPTVADLKGDPKAIWETLLCASALNMLRFDEALQHGVQQPIAKNVGWLDFTHAITFAEALFEEASTTPEVWRSGHLQMACFVGRNVSFLGENQLQKWMVPDARMFLARQKAALFDMDVGEYIYAVHRLKLIVAVEKLFRVVRPATQTLLLAATNRFLNSQVRQRHPARTAYQAQATVERE